MTKEKDTEHFIGQMVANIQVNGKTASNTVKVSTFVKKVNVKASGKMEKG
jgi:hypothetical protein